MKKKIFILTMVVCACFGWQGCGHTEHQMNIAARHLDAVEHQSADWGRITVSDIALAPDSGQFAVDYGTNAEFYIKSARAEIQGAASGSIEQTLTVLASLKASLTAPISAGSPGMAVVPALSTNTTQAPAPTSVGSNTPVTPKFSDALHILTDQKYSISERQALMIGMNDKIAETLLKFLSHPKDLPKNRKVLLGVTQVSCQPGSRTREGYIADVNVALSYLDEHQKSSVNENGAIFPSAWAVLPLLDAQQLDLRHSERNQLQLGLDLALTFFAQGLTGNAGALINYLKKKEADMASRTVMPLAVSYTDSASFGFQIMPAFQAVSKPAKAYDKSADVLQPVSFPVVVVLIVDIPDLSENGKAKWVNIRADVRSRWIPTKGGKSLSNVDRLQTAMHLDKARTIIKQENTGAASTAYAHGFGELQRSYGALWRYGLSATYYYSLKDIFPDVYMSKKERKQAKKKADDEQAAKNKPPEIVSVLPDKAWVNAPTVFSIAGANFTEGKESIVNSVTVAGHECKIAYVGPKIVVAILPGWTEDGNTVQLPAKICVTTKNGTKESTQNLVFDHRMASPPEQTPVFHVARDAKGNITGLNVQSTGGMGTKELLEAIKTWMGPVAPVRIIKQQ